MIGHIGSIKYMMDQYKTNSAGINTKGPEIPVKLTPKLEDAVPVTISKEARELANFVRTKNTLVISPYKVK